MDVSKDLIKSEDFLRVLFFVSHHKVIQRIPADVIIDNVIIDVVLIDVVLIDVVLIDVVLFGIFGIFRIFRILYSFSFRQ